MEIIKLYNYGTSEVLEGTQVDVTYAFESDVPSLMAAGWVTNPKDLLDE